MEAIILCIVFGVFMIISFTLGFKLGSGKEIKEEIVSTPKKKITNFFKTKEEKHDKEQEKLWKAITNIENYNGTAEGQEMID